MINFCKRYLAVLALVGGSFGAHAFSMMGPFTAWQVPQLGYAIGGDIGAPMNLGEEYRWNVKTIYYAYDESFVNYFGSGGTNAVEKAIKILNDLPAFSKMSSDLSEFSEDTKRVNYTASALNIFDMKSYALAVLMEELGLVSPERYVWCLRDRVVFPGSTNYLVMKRNFDPVSLNPSSYVNGVLYTYIIIDPLAPGVADAYEVQVDPLQRGFNSVASGISDQLFAGGHIVPGDYYTGLSRDDIGGLRYLYRTNNYQFETVLPGTTLGTTTGSGGSWTPIGGGTTNASSTNGFVNLAVRPGVDKITFKLAKYDSLVGFFIATTNVYTDTYVTNSTLRSQTLQRTIIEPDILWAAEDLAGGASIRTDTLSWINNDAINGNSPLDGPGVITPPISISFGKTGPYYINLNPGFLDEVRFFAPGFVWGHYDGTTNSPVVFPTGSSISELENQVLSGTGGNIISPWTIPNSFSTNSVDTSGTTGGTN